MTAQTTLVLGGTGKTGRRIVEQLTARNVPVRIGSRSATPALGYCWSSSRIVLDGLKSGKPQLCLLQIMIDVVKMCRPSTAMRRYTLGERLWHNLETDDGHASTPLTEGPP